MNTILIQDANQNDISISPVVFGTSGKEFSSGQCSDELFCQCIAQGINSFDTARLYGGGKTEKVLGDLLKRNNISREKVTIITKICHPAFGFIKKVNEKDALKQTQESLSALHLDYLDCLLLHRDDEKKSPEEIITFMNRLIQLGYTRSIGVSNWKTERIIKANQYANEHHLVPFVIGKAQFSLGRRITDPWHNGALTLTGKENEKEREFYRKSQMALLCYSSLGDGMFASSEITNDQDFKNSLSKDTRTAYYDETNLAVLKKAKELANQKNISLSQLALAYCFQQGFHCGCILPITSSKQAKEYLSATEISLSKEELSYLQC